MVRLRDGNRVGLSEKPLNDIPPAPAFQRSTACGVHVGCEGGLSADVVTRPWLQLRKFHDHGNPAWRRARLACSEPAADQSEASAFWLVRDVGFPRGVAA